MNLSLQIVCRDQCAVFWLWEVATVSRLVFGAGAIIPDRERQIPFVVRSEGLAGEA
jgi:hypothetical protein